MQLLVRTGDWFVASIQSKQRTNRESQVLRYISKCRSCDYVTINWNRIFESLYISRVNVKLSRVSRKVSVVCCNVLIKYIIAIVRQNREYASVYGVIIFLFTYFKLILLSLIKFSGKLQRMQNHRQVCIHIYISLTYNFYAIHFYEMFRPFITFLLDFILNWIFLCPIIIAINSHFT